MYVYNNELTHWGIKGQKWGIRRYQNEDGTLTQAGKERYAVGTGGNSKFDKRFREELSKFKKLSDKADVDVQKKAAETHTQKAKKAAEIGVAAGLTAAGATGLLNLQRKKYSQVTHENFVNNIKDEKLIKNYTKAIRENQENMREFADKLGVDISRSVKDQWAEQNKSADRLDDIVNQNRQNMKNLDNAFSTYSTISGIVTLASAAASATALGAAAYHGVSAAVAKHRLTEKGHAKAIERRDAQYKRISNMVKDTPYMALFKDQIEAYKKEHPNTELSDKQIMKNLM